MNTDSLVHAGPWTVEDLSSLPDNDLRYQLYAGTLLVNPVPDFMHQCLVSEIRHHVRAAAPRDLLAVTAPGISVPDGMLVPDVAVLPRALARLIRREVPGEDVLLVVEVESPYGRRWDRMLKATAYAEAGIPFYWRVEREDEQAPLVVVAQELRGEVYVETARLVPGTAGRIERPFPFEVDPAVLLP